MPEYTSPVAEASDSESEEEVPPPLPPPRTESLKKEVFHLQSAICNLESAICPRSLNFTLFAGSNGG